MMTYDEFEKEFFSGMNLTREDFLATKMSEKDLKSYLFCVKIFKMGEMLKIKNIDDEDEREFMFFGLFSFIIMLISMFDDIFKQSQNRRIDCLSL